VANPSLQELSTISDPPVPKLVLELDQQQVRNLMYTFSQYKYVKKLWLAMGERGEYAPCRNSPDILSKELVLNHMRE